MVLWCGTVGKSGLDLTEALLMGLLLQGAWDAPAIHCASAGMPSAGMNGWGQQVDELAGALAVWWEEQDTFWHTGFYRVPLLFGQKMLGFVQVHSWVSCVLLQEPHPYIARAHPAPCPKGQNRQRGIMLILGSHSPTAGLGSSTAHESSLELSTISQSKPNHETVLLLSDHVTSQKLCGGSTKSPVFSFAKLSQVIQSPECFFCQSEFAVIKLCCCEG